MYRESALVYLDVYCIVTKTCSLSQECYTTTWPLYYKTCAFIQI